MVGQVLEHVDDAGAHCILAGKQETEDNKCHFAIVEFSGDLSASIGNCLFLCVDKVANPLINHASNLSTVRNPNFGILACRFEMFHGSFTGLDCTIDFGTGEREWEIDQFKGKCNLPVVVANDLDSLLWDVLTAEDTERSMHVQIASRMHDRLRRGISLGILEPKCEMVAGNRVLDFEVNCESFAGEEGIKDASIVNVFFSIQEDPIKMRQYWPK